MTLPSKHWKWCQGHKTEMAEGKKSEYRNLWRLNRISPSASCTVTLHLCCLVSPCVHDASADGSRLLSHPWQGHQSSCEQSYRLTSWSVSTSHSLMKSTQTFYTNWLTTSTRKSQKHTKSYSVYGQSNQTSSSTNWQTNDRSKKKKRAHIIQKDCPIKNDTLTINRHSEKEWSWPFCSCNLPVRGRQRGISGADRIL